MAAHVRRILRGTVSKIVCEAVIRQYHRGDRRAPGRDLRNQVSRELISKVTDKVVDELAAWQSRPLDRVYPVVFVDAIHVKIRDGQVANRPIYVVLGIDCEGERDVLGLWVGTGGEGAKRWMTVLAELRNRGVADVCIVACDGLGERITLN